MESILTEFITNVLKELADHILAYLGIGAAAATVAGATYALNLRYKKSVLRTESVQNNEGNLTASDDIVNGNQTLINNYYYAPASTKTTVDTQDFKETPAPKDIVEEVERLPLEDQKEAKKSFLGQNFQWKVKFHKLKKKDGEGDQFRVFLSDPEEFGKPMIYCDLSLKDHPGFKELAEGDMLKVSGKLTCFNGREMNLDLAKVNYADAKIT